MESIITKDMTVRDIVEKHPESIPIMLSYGLHCVGCHAAGSESLEQGCHSHGMASDDIDCLVKDMNDAIADADEAPLKLDPLAASKIKEAMILENKKVLRVKATLGGNKGIEYDMSMVEQPNDDDVVIMSEGITMAIDDESLSIVRGSIIRFVEKEGGGFVFGPR